jgi:beta-1,4-N-acetylglucosaminyltransferase
MTVPAITSKKRFADVLLVNGPGTCVALVLVAYFNRVSQAIHLSMRLLTSSCQFWWLDSPRVVYIESFARVSSLSLSGKLVRPLADR